MPGSFTQVTTVTWHQTYGRPRVRRTILRDPGPQDRVPAAHFALQWPEGAAGPCGTHIPACERSAMGWMVAMLKDYAHHWGQNPLADSRIVRGRVGGAVGRSWEWA